MAKPFLLFFPFLLFTFLSYHRPASALPLSTNGRWIVNENNVRVKLACANWPGHVDNMVIEGLNKQPVDVIAQRMVDAGFNCVRITYATYMVANHSYANVTVRDSLLSRGLIESVAAITINNYEILDLTLLEAFKYVITILERYNIMVILDNQVTKPMWCCGREDGNGFFGDRYFDPKQWVDGLSRIATKFNGVPNVIGMSLRNELRGPNQTVADWYKYMQIGAEAVHKSNKDLLVVLSGLSFDNDLGFLHDKMVNVTFKNKLVFELHWYSFSNPGEWRNGNPNQVCARIAGNVAWKAGFLLDRGYPLFLSEFGIDQRGVNLEDNRYIPCVLSFLAEKDVDWALWALQGGYYSRQGQIGTDEAYSVLSYDWFHYRNETFLNILSSVQPPFRGPGLADQSEYLMIYHPATGKCVLRSEIGDPLKLGSCEETEAWGFNSHELGIVGSTYCAQAYGYGKAVRLGTMCGSSGSKFDKISASQMQLKSRLFTGEDNGLCLDVGSDGKTIVTYTCKCKNSAPDCDPEMQWFKLVTSTRKIISKNAILGRLH